jgi:hypothetical protein
MAELSRRRVLWASALILVPLAPACSRSLQQEAGPTLRRMARLLWPHAAVGDEIYAQVADGFLADAEGAERDLLLAGVRGLNSNSWLGQPEEAQIEALRAIEDDAFFQAVRAGVRDRLYALPAVWPAIGYPGSSLEFGGYLNRGYADINWLPEAR